MRSECFKLDTCDTTQSGMSLKQPDPHDARSFMNPVALRKYAHLVERVRSAMSEDREARLGLQEFTAAGRIYELMRVVLGSGATEGKPAPLPYTEALLAGSGEYQKAGG